MFFSYILRFHFDCSMYTIVILVNKIVSKIIPVVSPRGQGHEPHLQPPVTFPSGEGRKLAEAVPEGVDGFQSSKSRYLASKCDLVWALLGRKERQKVCK